MKKLFLLLLIFTNIQVFAAWHKSMVRVREERGRTISVTIDGIRYNKLGRTISIPNLEPGKHTIKVFAYNSNGYGYRSGIMLYQGNITLRAGRIYYCTAFEKALDIEENCCIDDYGHWNQNDNWDNWDVTSRRWNNNNKWYDEESARENNKDWNNNYYNNRNNNYEDNDWARYNGAISTSRYNQLIEQVRNSSFESSKVDVVNLMLKNNKINVDQLIGILKEFSFESTKLQFAEDNYYKVVDKGNYFLVSNVFTFQSSKDEMIKFLEMQGGR